MTRTTPELAPTSPSFHTTPAGGQWDTTHDLACNGPHYTVESGFEPGTLRPEAEGLPLVHRGSPSILESFSKRPLKCSKTGILKLDQLQSQKSRTFSCLKCYVSTFKTNIINNINTILLIAP
ncbi:hypothetical protein AVEN_115841-1 [Araneus ventricosus]|uniref:Uncharacterized protein n=1 Tax=Araneus ventricosus TaxID=182803 RepID=A0A4Y2IT17_ARAVE|nr:hypothetical protein AVEN_115841-1 [Araneus ventricosus]